MAMPVLEARKLSVGYGQVPVVRDLDLHVAAGEVVSLEISGEPRELAGRLSDVEDSYLGRTAPVAPGQ